jgi:uncharacterized protein YgbK (DUF1537 family)
MPDSPRIGVLADDLTGALASAGALRAHGLRASVVWEAEAPDGAEALAVNMRTRDEHEDVRSEARRWAAWLAELGCERLELRIDSTLRGDPAAELAGALEGAGRAGARVLAVPAAPRAGRVTVAGRQRAEAGPGGAALDREVGPVVFGGETFEVVSLNLVEEGPEAILSRIREAGPRVVVDATEDRHLEAIAHAASCIEAVTLSPGAWLRWYPVLEDAVVVVVLASPTAQNRDQLRVLAAEQAIVMIDAAETGPLNAPPLSRAVRTVVGEDTRGAETDPLGDVVRTVVIQTLAGDEHQPRTLAECAAIVTVAALEELRANHRRIAGVIASGGSTAAALLDRLAPTTLRAEGELAPLCPRGTLAGGPWSGLALVTKGGLIGESATLLELCEILHRENP